MVCLHDIDYNGSIKTIVFAPNRNTNPVWSSAALSVGFTCAFSFFGSMANDGVEIVDFNLFDQREDFNALR